MQYRRYLVENVKTKAKRTILVPMGVNPESHYLDIDERIICAVGKVDSK